MKTNIKRYSKKLLQSLLTHENNVNQFIMDNIPQGVFLLNKELKILPQYSLHLYTILSYHEMNLAGKNFLDILSTSLDAKRIQILKSYFELIFSKTKTEKVIEAANPLHEFEYKADNQIKTLATKFSLIETDGIEPVIIGIIQDITKVKNTEKEVFVKKESREIEMKNMFDIIQIDPLVFNDFIEDTETELNHINSLLKDKTLNEKQIAVKILHSIKELKSNASILKLDNFCRNLQVLGEKIKKLQEKTSLTSDDILKLNKNIEELIQEKDSYIKLVDKIKSFKVLNKSDAILVHTLNRAIEKYSKETKKDADLRAGHIDLRVLETNLRKPIKDILLQCVKNSMYHGIEPPEERINKMKKRYGILELSIKEKNGNAEIIFSDDGRGLDWEKIKAKYIKLKPDAKDTSNNALLPLIFLPGFTASEETSKTAGKGTGLSYVKDLVKEYGGTMKINSSENGLTMKFVFPMPK